MPVAMSRLTGERRSDRDFVYLLTLAGKYGLEPGDLQQALVKAKKGEESACGALSIQLRQQEGSRLFFMFSHNGQSVAQAAISEETLGKLRNVPPELKILLKKADPSSASDCSQMEKRIADLQIGLRRVCLKAKVTAKSEVRAIESRNGTPLVLCLATLSDGTGQIRLPLWNKWINSVAENDTVIIRGATVNNFRGEMQLSLPWKTGTISTVESAGAR
jgi:replication factor A1